MIIQDVRWRVYQEMKKKRYRKPLSAAQRKRKVQRNIRLGLVLLLAMFVLTGVLKIIHPSLFSQKYYELDGDNIDACRPEMEVDLLTPNEYSRPGTKTEKITAIVIHYTANPGATARGNRDYFENLKNTHITKASSNFVVGLDGEIIQCVPTWEVAYASNERNKDTISIECCHPDETGKFTEETYQSMVQLTAWLCRKYSLTADTVIRHYDVTGKNCPKYFVENEEAWANFKEDVANALAKGGTD